MSMWVELKGERFGLTFKRDGTVIRTRDNKEVGKIIKEGKEWVFKFFGNGKVYGKTRNEAVQNYYDWKNKISIICPSCNRSFKKSDSVIFNGLDFCKAHGNKNFSMNVYL